MAYSNSPLATYTKISPNKTTTNRMPIDRITIHHAAGNILVSSMGEMFARATQRSSSNYGVGTNGQIGMYVEEKHSSWCSSSTANDRRAITIEVANSSNTSSNWPVSDAALNATIKLCADICKRNGKNKLVYLGNYKDTEAYKPKSNEMILTRHDYFKNKCCPGPYLGGKFPYIVQEVNKLLGSNVQTPTVTTPAEDKVYDINSDNGIDAQVWKYFLSKGLNDYAIAGIEGNLDAESGLASNNLQSTFENKLGMTDAQYTEAVDNGTYTNFSEDGAGYGIAQWTYPTRKKNLAMLARLTKRSIGDLNLQLDFLWAEFTENFKSVYEKLQKVTSVKEASDIMLMEFEKPANAESYKDYRAGLAQAYYNKFHGSTIANKSKLPYLWRVNANLLNIRTGPGTNYGKNGAITDNGIYTITEEATGSGAKLWGKLKSGLGWISLDYGQKV